MDNLWSSKESKMLMVVVESRWSVYGCLMSFSFAVCVKIFIMKCQGRVAWRERTLRCWLGLSGTEGHKSWVGALLPGTEPQAGREAWLFQREDPGWSQAGWDNLFWPWSFPLGLRRRDFPEALGVSQPSSCRPRAPLSSLGRWSWARDSGNTMGELEAVWPGVNHSAP